MTIKTINNSISSNSLIDNNLFRLLGDKDYRNIFFDEPTHKYTDNMGNTYRSVTTVIHDYVPVFDKRYWATYESRKTGESVSSILSKWESINKHSVNKGNKKHNELENHVKFTSKFSNAIKYINIDNKLRCFSIKDILLDTTIGEMSISEFELRLNGKYPLILKTIKYYIDKGYRIYSEINVYNPNYLVSGTIDILLVKGNEFIIIDWKTNRKPILFNSGYYKKDKNGIVTSNFVLKKAFMSYPLDYIEDCNGNHYSLQLSLYALMVSAFGYKCNGLILFHINDLYVLNKYGMPAIDENGLYIKDERNIEIVTPHIISNMVTESKKAITYYYNKNKESISNQIKLEL
jgi:hypothetical protein